MSVLLCAVTATHALGATRAITRPHALGATHTAVQEAKPPFQPRIEPASGEARAALANFKVPEGFQVELFAAEPSFANPVCIAPDLHGGWYVGESFRVHQGVTDIREHMDWLDDDLACRTVEDRVAMYKKHLGERFPEFATAFERVSHLRDVDGDGVAEDARVLSDRFREAADGIGAGLLVHGSDVYYTCIPNLWLLRDTDGDGRANDEIVLSTGWGVRVAFLGHDMHGLRIGPDGLLYFSIGDRGFHVTTPQGVLAYPSTGAVLRCHLDGTHLEVFATGLRNPQELAFDAFGNLFTGDNNSDSGDKARLVHVIEGADSGWRQPYQWISEPTLRGPWNEEQLWVPHFAGQAAYIVPPIANLGDGPSGLTFNPGVGLPARYADRFFLCDFRGSAPSSGIHSFTLTPKGASFELGPVEPFVWGSLATDCEFGVDGALYWSDWVEGWNQTGKGRIYRAFDPATRASDSVRETRGVLADSTSVKSVDTLVVQLAHADQRVRQLAQFQLVAEALRTPDGYTLLTRVAHQAHPLLARVHAIWGLGMYLRDSGPMPVPFFTPLLEDPEVEIRAQAARVIGDLRDVASSAALVGRLADASPRVRMFAAIALGKVGQPLAVGALKGMLREVGETDPVLRHAAVMGLSGCATTEELADCERDDSIDVRVGAVVALRRRASAEVARFLDDASPRVSSEAARAIYDLPIADALPALAESLRSTAPAERPLVRRALHASYRLGTQEHARALAQFALRADRDVQLRAEALGRLAQWEKPPPRDAVVGEHWPIEPRGVSYMPEIVRELERGGVVGTDEAIVASWIELVGVYDVEDQAQRLAGWALDRERSSRLRTAALRGLVRLATDDLAPAVRAALSDRDGALRAVAVSAFGVLPADEAMPLLDLAAAQGEIAERRAALGVLAKADEPAAEAILVREVLRHAQHLAPAEIALDIVEAGRARGSPALTALLDATVRARAVDPAIAPYADALYGGDAEAGRTIFRAKAELSCLRCHEVEGEIEIDGGGRVGPSLRGIGQRLPRIALLESIVAPNRRMAPGYATSVLALNDGSYLDGRVVAEDDGTIRVMLASGETVEVDAADVETRKNGLSAMPEGQAAFLTPREMRDLIEYLSTL